MAMKTFRKDVGGETFAQFHKHSRIYRKKYGKLHSIYCRRWHTCSRAFWSIRKQNSKIAYLMRNRIMCKKKEKVKWQ